MSSWRIENAVDSETSSNKTFCLSLTSCLGNPCVPPFMKSQCEWAQKGLSPSWNNQEHPLVNQLTPDRHFQRLRGFRGCTAAVRQCAKGEWSYWASWGSWEPEDQHQECETEKSVPQHHLVQPTVSPKCCHQHWPKVSLPRQQAFSEELWSPPNLQRKHTEGELQMHAEHGRGHQAA